MVYCFKTALSIANTAFVKLPHTLMSVASTASLLTLNFYMCFIDSHYVIWVKMIQ